MMIVLMVIIMTIIEKLNRTRRCATDSRHITQRGGMYWSNSSTQRTCSSGTKYEVRSFFSTTTGGMRSIFNNISIFQFCKNIGIVWAFFNKLLTNKDDDEDAEEDAEDVAKDVHDDHLVIMMTILLTMMGMIPMMTTMMMKMRRMLQRMCMATT